MRNPTVTNDDSAQSLSDIVQPGLSILFCGINPGLRAASTGHHFAGRSNRFWKVLHRAGFTSEEFRPENDRHLLNHRYGLTVAVARPTARADQLSKAEIQAAAAQFELKIRHYAPRFIAFLGKLALAEMSGRRDIEWGMQARDYGGARAWVLPNPSGLNRSFSLDALVSAYRELRLAAESSILDQAAVAAAHSRVDPGRPGKILVLDGPKSAKRKLQKTGSISDN